MLALVAGDGLLPRIVAESVNGPFVLCVPYGTVPRVQGAAMRLNFRLETLGSFFQDLKSYGVTDVCFAGAVHRPKLDPSVVDDATRPLLEQISAALRFGDDGALRVVLSLFEQAGFRIVSVQDQLPHLLPATGVPTKAKPTDADGADAARAEIIVGAMGAVDVGQSCIVADGQALAIEAMPGTDWMLNSLCDPVENTAVRHFDPFDALISSVVEWVKETPPVRSRKSGVPDGGLLYKAPKPLQERRIDLPTIGPLTIRNAAEAGLRGVVVESGGVMVLEPETCIGIADACGLFLWVRERGLPAQ